MQIVRGTDKWIEILQASDDGGADRLAARRRGTDRRDDAAPGRRHPRNVRRGGGDRSRFFGTERAGISDEVKRPVRTEFLRIPMRDGRKPQRVGLGGDPALLAFSTRVRADGTSRRGRRALRTNAPDGAVWRLSRRDRDEVLCRWMQQTVRDPAGVLSRFESG
ncbi:MAG: hypothetical protein ACLR8Y_07850 [Alistipes indistinctus]